MNMITPLSWLRELVLRQSHGLFRLGDHLVLALDARRSGPHDEARATQDAQWPFLAALGPTLPDRRELQALAGHLTPDGQSLWLSWEPLGRPPKKLAPIVLAAGLWLRGAFSSDGGVVLWVSRPRRLQADRATANLLLAGLDATQWLRPRGSCMSPLMEEGDEILVRHGEIPGPGDVALILKPDGLVAHRIHHVFDVAGTTYVLQAGDKGVPEISPGWCVLGRVAAVRRPGGGQVHLVGRHPIPPGHLLRDIYVLLGLPTSGPIGQLARLLWQRLFPRGVQHQAHRTPWRATSSAGDIVGFPGNETWRLEQ